MSTSTLTSVDICARVRARLLPGLPDNMREQVDHNIALCIPGGMERLGQSVKDSTDRALLTITIPDIDPVQGRIDLMGATFASVLTDTFRLPGAIETFEPSNVTFHHAPSMEALKSTTPPDPTCVWYLLQGRYLIFKNPADGQLNTYNTTLALTGSYIPDLGSGTRPLPGELNDQAVSRVMEIVEKVGGMSFLTLDPDKASQVIQNSR